MKRICGVFAALFILPCVFADAQQTIGLKLHTPASVDNGYVLFAPLPYTTTYLIDKCGKQVHSWPSAYDPFCSAHLLDDGSIIRPGVRNNGSSNAYATTERIDWNGNVVWSAAVWDSIHRQHHDVEVLPSGNILVIANEIHSTADAKAAGLEVAYSPTSFVSEELEELKPVGSDGAEVVWRWRVWDHLVQDFSSRIPSYAVIAEHPELININFPKGAQNTDWLHINSVCYNAALDQVMVNCFNFGEIWIIDHATTTAEAASHTGGKQGKGGDLLYRWGNPLAYNRGTASSQRLLAQHDARWIPQGFPHAGEIMVFNNTESGPPTSWFSSVEIIAPPVDASGKYDTSILPLSPDASEWTYKDSPPSNFFSGGYGSAQMQANGNILICNGSKGVLFEVDSLKHKVWEYVNPVDGAGPEPQGSVLAQSPVFRCTFYPGTFAGLKGRTLTPGAPIEINPLGYDCTVFPDTILYFNVDANGSLNPLTMHDDTVDVGMSANDTLILVNKQVNAAVHVLNCALTGADSMEYSITKTITAPIKPNAADTIIVRFSPTKCYLRSAVLNITTDAHQHPSQLVALNGYGLCSRIRFTSKDTLFLNSHVSIGSANPIAYDTFSIINKGFFAVNIRSQTITGVNAADYAIVSPLPAVIEPGESDTAVIAFKPALANSNAKQAEYVLQSDAEVGATLTKELRGFADSMPVVPQTVGLISHKSGSWDNGLVLFAPSSSTTTYLIDKCGKEVHSWPGGHLPNSSAYLMDDGSILRPGFVNKQNTRAAGITERIDWDGNIVWHFALSDSNLSQHDDIAPLPNGDVLVIAREVHSRAEAIANGRDPNTAMFQLSSEVIVELKPIGADSAIVVWKWRVWDHLIQDFDPAERNYGVVAEHPELININYIGDGMSMDWLGLNSVSFNPALNLVMVSCRNIGEIWMIDHNTTTQTAASHSGGYHGRGGDLLYRWGNADAYNRGSNLSRKIFSPHDAVWIPNGFPQAGKIMVFDNGSGSPVGKYSSVEIFSPELDSPGVHNTSTDPLLPDNADWIFTDSTTANFYSNMYGSAQMLANGNVLMSKGESGMAVEIDSDGKGVWRYQCPVNEHGPVAEGTAPINTQVDRYTFYPASHLAFRGRTLDGRAPIELQPNAYSCTLNADTVLTGVVQQTMLPVDNTLIAFPNPATEQVTVSTTETIDRLELFDYLGESVCHGINTKTLNTQRLPNGVYVLVARQKNQVRTALISILQK